MVVGIPGRVIKTIDNDMELFLRHQLIIIMKIGTVFQKH
jgi:hypothetical protein